MGSPSFEQALRSILTLAHAAHDESNQIQSLAFADERGWISDDERTELGERETRYRDLTGTLGRQLEAMIEHPEWRPYLQRGIHVFAELEARHVSLEVPGRSAEDRRFDALICKPLYAAWIAILDGREPEHALSWAISVGDKMCDRYQKHI